VNLGASAKWTRFLGPVGKLEIGALELSEKKWVLAVQFPGVKRHTRHVSGESGEELATFIERLKARCGATGYPVARVILTHEAGREGFWLARF
jgi:transposase